MKANGRAGSAVRQPSPTKRDSATKRERKHKVAEERAENMGAGAVSGAIAGAAVGVIAGPAGAVAGGAIGAVAGAAAGAAMADDAERRSKNDEELDEEIGVTKGSLGAPSLKHPPAKIGAYSSGSTGTGPSPHSSPAEGPMQPPEEEE